MGLSHANRKFFLKTSENNPRYSNQCRAAVMTTPLERPPAKVSILEA
jgi:hypothetical protein